VNNAIDGTTTYVGTLDDAVQRYPWKFRLDQRQLDHLLVVELIHGNPLLLNDGYLLLHPLCRAALMNEDGLLWHLIRAGFVRVMHRGGDAFGLHELPSKMAPAVSSFAKMLDGSVDDIAWTELRPRVERLDGMLRDNGHLVAWPRYDATSGFLALTRRLCERRVTARQLGLARGTMQKAPDDFLQRVVDRISENPCAARTQWEQVAKRYANSPRYTKHPRRFMRATMNLASEIYHYNMGMLLAAEHGAGVSVQTQVSPAFDDLLAPAQKKVALHELDAIARLHVPASVAAIDPHRLVGILVPGTALFEARQHWMGLRRSWELALPGQRDELTRELNASARHYAKALAGHLGPHAKHDEAEGFIEYVVDGGIKAAWDKLGGMKAGAAAAAAATAAGIDPTMTAATGFLTAYAVAKLNKKMLGHVFRKYRVEVLEGSMTHSSSISRGSKRLMQAITRRGMPSSIEITPEIAEAIKPSLTRFSG
jgi:hypothetical protein